MLTHSTQPTNPSNISDPLPLPRAKSQWPTYSLLRLFPKNRHFRGLSSASLLFLGPIDSYDCLRCKTKKEIIESVRKLFVGDEIVEELEVAVNWFEEWVAPDWVYKDEDLD